MRKFQLLILAVLTATLFWGCTAAQPEQPENTNQTVGQTLPQETEEPIPSGQTEETTPSHPPEKELREVTECATGEGFLTAESREREEPCSVRLFKEWYTDEMQGHLLLEVSLGEKVLRAELDECIPATTPSRIHCADVDGDGIQEILVHYNTGGVGGFGLYQTWVLKLAEDEVRILFENFAEFDTGFESRFPDGYHMEVSNRITGYKLVFDAKDAYRKQYEEGGKVLDYQIYMDPFYEFAPEDVDGDGISEILCKQYTSCIGHADYTGTACSVLKFNTQTQTFEVIDAWYEPNTEG